MTKIKTTEPTQQLEERQEKISIPRLGIEFAKIRIKGVSPLMVNRFDEKSKKQIEENFRGKAKNKVVPKSVEQEFEDSLYFIEKGKHPVYGVPAAGLKKCAVSACRFVDGVPMTMAKGAFHVVSGPNGLVPIKTPGPVMDERTVKVGNFGNKKPATRRRGRFDEWEVEFVVRYNSGVINAETLLNLYENAGFSVGLCEYRPEKDGDMGMFEVSRS